MIVQIKKEQLAQGLENFVESIQQSNCTEELFIVFNDDIWWRLFWNPEMKRWKTTLHQNLWKNSIYMKSSELISELASLKNELLKSRGFEYKTSRGITAYKVTG